VDEATLSLRRIAAVGQRTEQGRHIPPLKMQPELLQTHQGCSRDVSFRARLPIPTVLREAQRKEGLHPRLW